MRLPPVSAHRRPTPVIRREPDFPKEALEQIRALKGQLERKDKQIEQVMEAYRSKKSETEKLRERIEKTERRRFEQSKGDFIARFRRSPRQPRPRDRLHRAKLRRRFGPPRHHAGPFAAGSTPQDRGLEKIFVRGQPFDPMHSEAAEMEAVPEKTQDGVVIKELHAGLHAEGLAPARGPRRRRPVSSIAPPPPDRAGSYHRARRYTAVAPPADNAAENRPSQDNWETDEASRELEFGRRRAGFQ